jgi:hypothetical protein
MTEEKTEFHRIVTTYKTLPCLYGVKCLNTEICEGYHSDKDKRQLKCIVTVLPTLYHCKFNSCLKNDCFGYHNEYEKQYHPHIFRLTDCTNYKKHLHTYCPFNHERKIFQSEREETFKSFKLIIDYHYLISKSSFPH